MMLHTCPRGYVKNELKTGKFKERHVINIAEMQCFQNYLHHFCGVIDYILKLDNR